MFRKAYLLLLVLVLIPYISHAETKTIYETNKYVMGDNDSKNDARRMCFLEAKRKVLEKAGTYIESHTQVKNYKLKKDEINSYSAALLKVETVKEEWKLAGENMAIFITVKAEVDSSYIEKQLANIKKDTSVQKKIQDQQRQLQELERTVTDLQKQLGSVSATQAPVLRKERNVTFTEIDALEAKKIKILTRIESRSRDAKELITPGMTKREVKSLLGYPDGEEEYTFYYGTTKIRFNSVGLVWQID
jgi:archaellum component FlaC